MAKQNKGPNPKQGFVDKILHGTPHGGHHDPVGDFEREERDPEPHEIGEGVDPVSSEDLEDDVPIESPKKVSAGRGASSDSKHQHRKFDKFKKGI